MTILARLVLMLALAATSLGLGAARGQLPTGAQVVLCAGGAVAIVEIGADGAPVRRTHICPDMALAFLAGFDAPPRLPPLCAAECAEVVRLAEGITVVPPAVTMRQARGPPPLRAG